MTDFSKAIENAQHLPELPDDLENALPDPFKSGTGPDSLMGRSGEDDGVPNIGKFDYQYYCKRFIVGQLQIGFHKGQEEFIDHDDSPELKDIMDKSFNAGVIIIKKQESFLRDGTVVVWMEWAEPKPSKPKEGGSPLTLEELVSPRSIKPDRDLMDPEDSST